MRSFEQFHLPGNWKVIRLLRNAEFFYGYRTTSIQNATIDKDDSSRAGGVADAAWSFDKDSFLNFQVRAGGITGTRGIDVIEDFNLGGFLSLSGLRTNQLTGNYMAFGRMVGYHQIATLPVIGRAVYVGASLEAGNTWRNSSAVSLIDMYTAGSVFVAADTWLGPFYVAYGLASGGQRSFYLYLGRL